MLAAFHMREASLDSLQGRLHIHMAHHSRRLELWHNHMAFAACLQLVAFLAVGEACLVLPVAACLEHLVAASLALAAFLVQVACLAPLAACLVLEACRALQDSPWAAFLEAFPLAAYLGAAFHSLDSPLVVLLGSHGPSESLDAAFLACLIPAVSNLQQDRCHDHALCFCFVAHSGRLHVLGFGSFCGFCFDFLRSLTRSVCDCRAHRGYHGHRSCGSALLSLECWLPAFVASLAQLFSAPAAVPLPLGPEWLLVAL